MRVRLRVARDFEDLTAAIGNTSRLSRQGRAQVRNAGERKERATLSLTEI